MFEPQHSTFVSFFISHKEFQVTQLLYTIIMLWNHSCLYEEVHIAKATSIGNIDSRRAK